MANCPCPPGYVSSGNNCVRTTNSAATNNGVFYTAQFAGPYPYWGNLGTNFYADITNLPKPLGGNGTNILDANSAVVPVANNVQSPVWGQTMFTGGPYYGRQNVCGLWTTLPTVPSTSWPGADDYPPLQEWIGFSTCFTAPVAGTYCIGMAADNCLRFKIDGQLICQLGTTSSGGYPFNFNYWHVFPITLSAGQHIIEMEGLNQALVAFFGAEIYNATPQQLAAMTTPAEVQDACIFTTMDKFGQQFDLGQQSGYSCGNGCALNLCGPAPQCTCYDIQAADSCCFRLTNCLTGQVIITSTDLSANVGNVVNIQGQSGCWQVTTAANCDSAVSVVVTASYLSCQSCLPCYLLTDCTNSSITFTTTVNLSSYIGQVVEINGYPGRCWTVSAASNCPNPVDIQIVGAFSSCQNCLCRRYLLTDCDGVDGPVLTNTDLSQYVGKIIKIKGCSTCWIVSCSTKTAGAEPVVFVESFDTCELCNPPEGAPDPELLRQRAVRPGYSTPGCDPDYTDRVNCEFAEAIYSVVKKRRYGISSCCEEDVQKWTIKKQLLDLRAIYDPTLCVTCPPVTCCTPCPAPTPPVPPTPISCPAPSNVTADIEIITPCPAPETPITAQIVFNQTSTSGFPPKLLT